MIAVGGVFGGATYAVFIMGIFIPVVNQKGAIIGTLCGTGRFNIFN